MRFTQQVEVHLLALLQSRTLLARPCQIAFVAPPAAAFEEIED
jgi:hypothetical protein